MGPAQKIPAKLRLRLMIGLPALVSLFMLITAMSIIFVFPGVLIPREMTENTVRQSAALWMLLMTALAFGGNLVAGLLISRQLNSLMWKVESSMPRDPSRPPEIRAASEIDALGIMLDEASVTLNRFVNDSYIIDNLPEAVVTVDAAGKIIRLNSKAAKLLKVESEEFLGRDLKEFIPDTLMSRTFYRFVDRGLKGASFHLEVVSFSVGTGESRRYWVSVHPVRRDSHLPAAVSISIKDQASIVAVRNQIQKIERLAAVGRMASSIAHEVRNPLGAIRTFTELIEEDLPPDDSRARYTHEILVQIERLNHLIEEVLAFSRDTVRQIKSVDLAELLSRTVSLARYKYPEKAVVVEESYRPGLPQVRGDPEKLSQAFLNLFINSFEACGDRGSIAVSADFEPDPSGNGRTLCISITDTGKGISLEDMNKLFEPFFTTKPNGNGLGLATAYNIVSAHGGMIDVYSEPDRGTTFHVFLPEKHHFCELRSEDEWSCVSHA